MRIYSMTATFGKLVHETLTLEPGLNIIQASNEWGKSTWCAFLIDMLYGVETSARSTKTALADKERYAPWSGEPMSGSIALNWQGRDITIERRSRGRAVFGEFRAFETDTGLPVPELTAANCGQVLLGVERSVFARAGFLRLTDLPVTQDESLRRRLNALVTTGDESGTGDMLGQKLKDLKNRCRFNKTGLLPQTENQRAETARKLEQLRALQAQAQQIQSRQEELQEWTARLENHRNNLAWTQAQKTAQRVKDAQDAAQAAADRVQHLEQTCAQLPPLAQTEQRLHSLQKLQNRQSAMDMEARMLPQMPERPDTQAPFQGMSGQAAVQMAAQDAKLWEALAKGRGGLYWILLAVGIVAGAVLALALPALWFLGLLPPAVGALLLIGNLTGRRRKTRQMRELERKYGGAEVHRWQELANCYDSALARYQQARDAYEAARGEHDSQQAALRQEAEALTGGRLIGECQDAWTQIRDIWLAYEDAQREYRRALAHAQVLQEMAKDVKAPELPDTMTYSEAETNRLLSDGGYEQRQLQLKLGQCQGQMENLGQEAPLMWQLEQMDARIAALEDLYGALDIAQDALTQAKSALQRRFAPRIAQRAQTIFSALTDGRYDRLTLEQDFSLQVSARQEDTLRSVLWRSDGTVDQLYFVLRLAVAEELTPEAPLILDDALVRFDDDRLVAALKVLKAQAQSKQVLLFSCQSREKAIAPKV